MQGEESHEPLCGAQCGIRSGKRPHSTVALRERRRSDDDKGLHRNGAARQLTADFLGSKVLADRQAEPSLVPMAIIARTTSPGFSGRRAPAAQARAVRTARPNLRATWPEPL
jgi:hypothetical protein